MKSSCREGGVDLQIVPRPSWGKKNNTLTGSSSGLGHCSFPVTRPTPARQQSVFYCFIFTLFYVLMRTFWLGWPKGRLSETAPGLAGERLLARLEVEGECTGSRVDWPTAWPGPASPDKQDRQDGVSSCPAPVLLTRTSRLRTTNRTKTQGATPSHYKNKYQNIITIHLFWVIVDSSVQRRG